MMWHYLDTHFIIVSFSDEEVGPVPTKAKITAGYEAELYPCYEQVRTLNEMVYTIEYFAEITTIVTCGHEYSRAEFFEKAKDIWRALNQ